MGRGIWGLGTVAAAALAVPAGGESIAMNGTFVAKAREVALLRSLAVERFAGRDGQALSLSLERLLVADGYFRLSPGGGEGLVSGAVSTSVHESPYRERRKECVERVEKKCVREIEQDIRCTRRTVEPNADVRVADRTADRIVFSAPLSRRDTTGWCEDQSSPRSAEAVVRGMIDDVAQELATAFAPRDERYKVKLLENDKGMTKDQKATFKAAVKQSKRDVAGACAAWAAFDTALPNHPSVVFDLGVCAEAAGDFAGAERLYRRAGTLGRGDEADAGIGRIRDIWPRARMPRPAPPLTSGGISRPWAGPWSRSPARSAPLSCPWRHRARRAA